MYQISLSPHTGKWKVILADGSVMGDKYSSRKKAAYALYKYLKGQE